MLLLCVCCVFIGLCVLVCVCSVCCLLLGCVCVCGVVYSKVVVDCQLVLMLALKQDQDMEAGSFL